MAYNLMLLSSPTICMLNSINTTCQQRSNIIKIVSNYRKKQLIPTKINENRYLISITGRLTV
ncbi:MAG: hypothetical protein ACI81A_001835, partial [Paraglaciecola sp.]